MRQILFNSTIHCISLLLLISVSLSTSSSSSVSSKGYPFTPCALEACNGRQDCIEGICVCKEGWTGVECGDDLDECTNLDPLPCSFAGGYCVDRHPSEGKYACGCDKNGGHWRDGPIQNSHGVTSCVDVNECIEWENPCADNAICTNTPGYYDCSCEEGFIGNGYNECERIPTETEEKFTCEDLTCDSKSSYCDDSGETPFCKCLNGFWQASPNLKCSDTDECEKSDRNDCHRFATCFNTIGSYYCTCQDGYEDVSTGNKGTKCRQINECLEGEYPCPEGFSCEDRAPPEKFVCLDSRTLTLPPSPGPTPGQAFLQPSSPTLPQILTPTRAPTELPTTLPKDSALSDFPTFQPSDQPSDQPSIELSVEPSAEPSVEPSVKPSVKPSVEPSVEASDVPSIEGSSQPSVKASSQPSSVHSNVPSIEASILPSSSPTMDLSLTPSMLPSLRPSMLPSTEPSIETNEPTIPAPSSSPSVDPSVSPSQSSPKPSETPSTSPSDSPSSSPTIKSSSSPSESPTQQSEAPSLSPTNAVFDAVPLELELTTDDVGEETSYRLYDVLKDELIWYSAASPGNTFVTEIAFIDPNGCYYFILRDLFADGLCCEFGRGDFRLLFYGTEVALYDSDDVTDGDSFKTMAFAYVGSGCDDMPLLPPALDSSCKGMCGSSELQPTGCSCDCIMTQVERSDNKLPATNFGDCCPDFVAACTSTTQALADTEPSETLKVEYTKKDMDGTVPVVSVFDDTRLIGKESCDPNSECAISIDSDSAGLNCSDIYIILEEMSNDWIYAEDVILSVTFNGKNVLYYEGNIFPGILGLDCTSFGDLR